MDFPTAQACTFVTLALPGPLHLFPALAWTLSSSWPERQPRALGHLRDDGEGSPSGREGGEQSYQLQNRAPSPATAGRGGGFPSGKR